MTFEINKRTYQSPSHPIAVIFLDGCADEYLSTAMALGKMPRLSAMARDGWRGFVRGALPSFTNVNNTSIVTGVVPRVPAFAEIFARLHGEICRTCEVLSLG
jgi:phosphonoacetate hydrolase